MLKGMASLVDSLELCVLLPFVALESGIALQILDQFVLIEKLSVHPSTKPVLSQSFILRRSSGRTAESKGSGRTEKAEVIDVFPFMLSLCRSRNHGCP